ncbi:unnamed protein product [Calypogeia fissa]
MGASDASSPFNWSPPNTIDNNSGLPSIFKFRNPEGMQSKRISLFVSPRWINTLCVHAILADDRYSDSK